VEKIRRDRLKERILTYVDDRKRIKPIKKYLEASDFFSAPASVNFHMNVIGGLVQHSWNVYRILCRIDDEYQLNYPAESLFICGIFHDLCKVHLYKYNEKNKKFSIEEQSHKLSVGHGEQSALELLRNGVILTKEEIEAIRWHMGAFDKSTDRKALNKSCEYSKLVSALISADYEAAHFKDWQFESNEPEFEHYITLKNKYE